MGGREANEKRAAVQNQSGDPVSVAQVFQLSESTQVKDTLASIEDSMDNLGRQKTMERVYGYLNEPTRYMQRLERRPAATEIQSSAQEESHEPKASPSSVYRYLNEPHKYMKTTKNNKDRITARKRRREEIFNAIIKQSAKPDSGSSSLTYDYDKIYKLSQE